MTKWLRGVLDFFLRNHHSLALKYNTFSDLLLQGPLYVSPFSTLAASAIFSSNNFFASAQTRACSLSGNSNNEGRRSALNCSDASLGSRVGRWSIEITSKGGFSGLLVTTSSASVMFDRGCSWHYSPDGYRDCRLGESRVHGINWNGVVRICRITTDIHDHT